MTIDLLRSEKMTREEKFDLRDKIIEAAEEKIAAAFDLISKLNRETYKSKGDQLNDMIRVGKLGQSIKELYNAADIIICRE